MAVIAIHEKPQGRTGSINWENVRDYKRVFQVETNSKLDGPAFVYSSLGIFLFDAYVSKDITEVDTLARAKNFSSKCTDDNGRFWEVVVEYGKIEIDTQEEENPLNRPAQVSFSFAQFERLIEEDRDGKIIANKAGDPIPNIVIDDSRPVIVITRNEATAPTALAVNSKDKIKLGHFLWC